MFRIEIHEHENETSTPPGRSRVRLIQEFDRLAVEDVIALINDLEPLALCVCGHTADAHNGKVGRCAHSGSRVVETPGNHCGCHQYRTQADNRMLNLESKLAEAQAEAKRMAGMLNERDTWGLKLREANARLKRSRDRMIANRARERADG